jgi:hypothetical protein
MGKTAQEILYEIATQHWTWGNDEGVSFCAFCGASNFSWTKGCMKKKVWHNKPCLWVQAREYFKLPIVNFFENPELNEGL